MEPPVCPFPQQILSFSLGDIISLSLLESSEMTSNLPQSCWSCSEQRYGLLMKAAEQRNLFHFSLSLSQGEEEM